jgi:hydrogenase maturation protease
MTIGSHHGGGAGSTLVLGIGNPLLSDDTAGLHAVRMAQERYRDRWVNVQYATHTGDSFDLLYEITECQRLILVDSISTGERPAGYCHLIPADQVMSWSAGQMLVPHSLDLPALFRLGHLCGIPMPREAIFLGIEGAEFSTFSEQPTAPVAAALGEAVNRIGSILARWAATKELL